MHFLVKSERDALNAMLKEYHEQNNTTPQDATNDVQLVRYALKHISGGSPDRLYAMLHKRGRKAHADANAGLTLMKMHAIASEDPA